MDNWRITGHEWAVQGLERSLSAGRLAHAHLFTGPHAIGKTTLARALAQALECTGTVRPCGKCPACQKVAHNLHPDVLVVEGVPPRFDFDQDPPPPPRASDRERRTLRIRQIRDAEHWLSRSPFQGRHKILILRRFEEAEEAAANAFLKTLEEPPSYARLILTARDATLLLPTIVSRCQVLSLRPLPLESVEAALAGGWQVDPGKARLLARLSGGRLGWAARAHADPSIWDLRVTHLDELATTLAEGRAERLTRAGELAKDAEGLPELLEEWVDWWRDVVLIQSGKAARIKNADRERLLQDHAQRLTLEQVSAALAETRATMRRLEQNANTRLALEVLLLKLPSLPRLPQ